MAERALESFDLIVVGAGMAGAAVALAMAEENLKVALIDGQKMPEGWPPVLDDSVLDYDARVSALTAASRQFLDELGVWQGIVERRACAYRDMEVWDAEGTGRIHFSAAEVNQSALGHIVENRLVNAGLLEALRASRVQCVLGAPVKSYRREAGRGVLELEDGRRLGSPLVVAADGANSRLREAGGFQTREWNYHHHAIVCTVETESPHQDRAWQRFLPEGPLAFLPLADAAGSGRYCSIVWSALPDVATQLMGLDDDAFAQSLTRHFEGRLGEVLACSKRFSFPLRQRHAVDYVKDGIVLVGDAAHTIHPLAGQGINLGFADAQALADELKRALRRGLMLSDNVALARYQRRRKGDNLAMMAAMEGFQHLFESPAMPLRLARNLGMSLLDRAVPLKRQIIARAMGLPVL
ncbi:UbiH/UbiF/VisC/COQ6 family ubiquinone biosynthesis hydroxylase [Spongiibacter sp. KMU-166]|uniref:UbiH/UbiF/VisC/COQ6 family ubiquinone biosynthesis hydroxylase n=1 Tax=Spongiibacter thalassae TaxID=2721624 RepID=A0ABX1GHR9_9GAMM|nr:UbiH/UbiF/VisC/COQ6 family ubiquinone biosynthesis hydroxylase [Spongiibacter thalassae]NKI18764.1 UbiH/UbiF/VisC/COQ6 family ubiquinone biosynthesis hydroxylase [Spongiibacter thalassae]